MVYAWIKLQCVPVLYFLDDEIFLRQFASAIKKGTLTIQGLLDEIHRGRKMPPLKIIKQLRQSTKQRVPTAKAQQFLTLQMDIRLASRYSLRKKSYNLTRKIFKKCITTKTRKQMRFLKSGIFKPSKLQKNCRSIGKRQLKSNFSL